LNHSNSNLSSRIKELNEPQRKVFGNKDVNIYKEKIKKNNKGSYFEKLKSSGNQENKRILSNSMDCLVLAYSNSTLKNKLFSANSYDILSNKNRNSLQSLDYSIYNNIKHDYKRNSCLSKLNDTGISSSTNNNIYGNNRSNYFNNNENYEFYLRPKINQVYSKSWPPSIFTSCHTKLLYKIEQVIGDILRTPAEKYIGTSVAIDFMKDLNELINEQKSLVVGDPEIEDILTKLLYVYSPVVRISEFYNQYISSLEKLESEEFEYVKRNRPSISNKRTSKLSSGFNFNNDSDSMSNVNSTVEDSKCNVESSQNNITYDSSVSLKDAANNKINENTNINNTLTNNSEETIKNSQIISEEISRKRSIHDRLDSRKNSEDYSMPKKKSSVSFDIKLKHIEEKVDDENINNNSFIDEQTQENDENKEKEKEKTEDKMIEESNEEKIIEKIIDINNTMENNDDKHNKEDINNKIIEEDINDNKELKDENFNNVKIETFYVVSNHNKEESTNVVDDKENDSEVELEYRSSLENCSELMNDSYATNDEDDHHDDNKSKKSSKTKASKIKKEKKKVDSKSHSKSVMNDEYSTPK